MPWERRKGRGRYYVRAHRVNGDMIREYVGIGAEAEAAARTDAAAREARAAQQAAQRRTRAEACDLERELDALCGAVDDLIGLELRAAGYHQHARGAWRKSRVTPVTPVTAAGATVS